MDLTDLDETMKKKLENFQGSVNKIQEMLGTALDKDAFDALELKEKVDYDLFIAYTLNTLFYLYLKTKGANPMKSQVKDELTRIKQWMLKAKEAHERNTIRPKLNKAAAGRFIKHGLSHSDKDKEEEKQGSKRKRED